VHISVSIAVILKALKGDVVFAKVEDPREERTWLFCVMRNPGAGLITPDAAPFMREKKRSREDWRVERVQAAETTHAQNRGGRE
jgi:hypothetical protein